VITLYQYPRSYGIPNASPFCMKIETFLKLSNLDYQVEELTNPASAPRKKLPYIKDSDDTLVADSNLILKYLEQKYNIDLNSHLEEKDLALGHLVQRTLEEGTYWILFNARWSDNEIWGQVKKSFFGTMPPVIKAIVPELIRKDVIKTFWRQGLSRYSKEEILEALDRDMSSLSYVLGENKFLLGEKPSAFDCSVYSFLENLLVEEPDTGLREAAYKYSNLTDYTERMRELCFS